MYYEYEEDADSITGSVDSGDGDYDASPSLDWLCQYSYIRRLGPGNLSVTSISMPACLLDQTGESAVTAGVSVPVMSVLFLFENARIGNERPWTV